MSSVIQLRSAAVATLILVAAGSSCGGSRSERVPPEIDASADVHRGIRDVVLVTVDTLRWDATGFSGSGKVATPTMDRLASGGVVFPVAHAHAVVTLPSHASLLTGHYPFRHGIRDNAGFVLPDGTPTLASLLAGRDFSTAAFVSAFPLDRRFGLDQGFDVYDDEYQRYAPRAFIIAERPGAETVAAAKTWWESHRGRRRFLWLHLFSPHFPYEPPEPFASRYRSQPYYGEVALADAQLAALLDPILDDPDESALVVLTSDHGESLGEHGERSHGLFAYEATLRVPLVFWAPGMLRSGVDRRPARHVDVLPTILDLLGLEAPEGLPGVSLARPAPVKPGDSYFEALSGHLNRGWAPLVGVLEGGHRKAIRLPVPELYDLERDPLELDNLATSEPDALAELLARVPARAVEEAAREPLDPDTVAKLRSLGYVAGSGGNEDPANGAEPDPKNVVGIEAGLDEAAGRYRAGDIDGAVGVLERLIEEQPRLAVAYSHLASIHGDAGRTEDAIAVLRRAIALRIADESMRTLLAINLLRAGRAEKAQRALSGDLESSNPRTQCTLGSIAAALGRPDEAAARLRRALDLDPSFPDAFLEFGLLELRRQRLGEARSWLERAVDGNPYLARGWNALGIVRMESKDMEGAIEAWEIASRADPSLPDPLFNIGLALAKTGDYTRAASALERYVPLVEGARRERALMLLQSMKRRAGAGP